MPTEQSADTAVTRLANSMAAATVIAGFGSTSPSKTESYTSVMVMVGLTNPSPRQLRQVCSPVAPHIAHAVRGILLWLRGMLLNG